jgi:hypothetical protein
MNAVFTKLARQSFDFLTHEGFAEIDANAISITFASAAAIVAVNWDSRSGELDVLFGLPSKVRQPALYSLTDILRMEGADEPERISPFQISQVDRLERFLNKLALDSRQYARPALNGDRMFFRRLEIFRSAEAKAAMLETELSRVRSDATKAWHRRDFTKLVSLYTSIKDHLSEAEKKKLEYAERQVRLSSSSHHL